MPSEASESLITRTTRITQETDANLMKFARERNLIKENRGLNVETNEIMVITVPNVSEAMRIALEEFFAKRKT